MPIIIKIAVPIPIFTSDGVQAAIIRGTTVGMIHGITVRRGGIRITDITIAGGTILGTLAEVGTARGITTVGIRHTMEDGTIRGTMAVITVVVTIKDIMTDIILHCPEVAQDEVQELTEQVRQIIE